MTANPEGKRTWMITGAARGIGAKIAAAALATSTDFPTGT
jgi:NAD(P)-dependent dehydrogenase (short-subunit alcohol dehydrogenase family)